MLRISFQIEKDREYPVRSYNFDSIDTVEKYWYQIVKTELYFDNGHPRMCSGCCRYEMYEICMGTPLGGSSAYEGKEVTYWILDKKPAMLATLQPKTSQEVRVPGSIFVRTFFCQKKKMFTFS